MAAMLFVVLAALTAAGSAYAFVRVRGAYVRWMAARRTFSDKLAALYSRHDALETDIMRIMPGTLPEAVRGRVLNCKCNAMNALRSVRSILNQAEGFGQLRPVMSSPLLREAEAMLDIVAEYADVAAAAAPQWLEDERRLARSLFEWAKGWHRDTTAKLAKAKDDGVVFGDELKRLAALGESLEMSEAVLRVDPGSAMRMIGLQIMAVFREGARAEVRIILCRQILESAANARTRVEAVRTQCRASASASVTGIPAMGDEPRRDMKAFGALSARAEAVADGIDRAVALMRSDHDRLFEALVAVEREDAALRDLENDAATLAAALKAARS